MRKFFRYVLAIAALAFLPSFAQAQVAGSQVYWNGSRMDAATVVGTSKTSAATITVAAVSGQYFYLTGIDVTNCAGAAAVIAAAPTDITSTNMNSAAWTVGSGATAGLCQTANFSNFGPSGLKSAAPGTATTFVLPTFATNQVIRVSVYGYYAQ